MRRNCVFLIVQHLSPGGIEVLALNLLTKLREDSDLHIVALEGRKVEALKRWPVLMEYQDRLHFLAKREGLSMQTMVRLMAMFIRYRPRAVHTHHIGPLLYGGLAARLAFVKQLIHTEHDGWHLNENGKKQSLIMRILRPTMIAVADNVASCVAEKCKTDVPDVIYNGIDTQKFSVGHQAMARFSNYLPQGVRLIGAAGRLEEVKGHRYLIEAMQYVPEDVHLAIAGDGSQKAKLTRMVHDLGLESRVHLLGRVDDMRSFYRALDVFCLPSLNEGFPLSPLEAQACGIPAVLSNVGGCSEALCADTGFLAKAGDALDLASQINMALAGQCELSPRGFILKNFDLESMASAYQRLYFGQSMKEVCHV